MTCFIHGPLSNVRHNVGSNNSPAVTRALKTTSIAVILLSLTTTIRASVYVNPSITVEKFGTQLNVVPITVTRHLKKKDMSKRSIIRSLTNCAKVKIVVLRCVLRENNGLFLHLIIKCDEKWIPNSKLRCRLSGWTTVRLQNTFLTQHFIQKRL